MIAINYRSVFCHVHTQVRHKFLSYERRLLGL